MFLTRVDIRLGDFEVEETIKEILEESAYLQIKKDVDRSFNQISGQVMNDENKKANRKKQLLLLLFFFKHHKEFQYY